MNNALRIFGLLIYIISLIITISCSSDRNNTDNTDDSINNRVDIKENKISKGILWSYDPENDTIVKQDLEVNLTIENVLNELNKIYTKADISLLKSSNDTIFVHVANVNFLKELGSTGNYAFLAEVVYNLTEVPEVNFVDLDFETIDHAMPGVYSRTTLENKL